MPILGCAKVVLIENRGDITEKTLGGNIEIRNQKGKHHTRTTGGNI